MSNIIKSVIFGIIEGITEWLPISSTGHLIIAERFISFNGVSDGFYEIYSVVIQFGAVLSVAVLYFKNLSPYEVLNKKITADKTKLNLWIKIIIGCIPAALTGIMMNDFIDFYFFNYKTVAFALIVYGFIFLLIEKSKRGQSPVYFTPDDISFKTAFFIGLFQVLSLIPGTSRSGATIIGGLLCGTSRTAAAQFTFYMALPVMLGASAVKLFKFGFAFSSEEIILLITGFLTAFAVSVITIKKLMDFVKNHSFVSFGYYRIILGICIIYFFSIFK